MISWNINVIGSVLKKKQVKEGSGRATQDMVMLQETKIAKLTPFYSEVCGRVDLRNGQSFHLVGQWGGC